MSSAEVIARYEQILERAPLAGSSFDRLVQIHEKGEGLEKLDALLRGLLADHADLAVKFQEVVPPSPA